MSDYIKIAKGVWQGVKVVTNLIRLKKAAKKKAKLQRKQEKIFEDLHNVEKHEQKLKDIQIDLDMFNELQDMRRLGL